MNFKNITTLFVLWMTVFSLPVNSDEPCPTNQTADDAILKIDGFSAASGHTYEYNIGVFDYYIYKFVGVCIKSATLGTQTLHAITDANGYPLAHLPRSNNHLCLSNSSSVSETTYVLEKNEKHCGITMYPLDYHGFALYQYGRRGSDHLHGGTGDDFIYGGSGNDNLADYTNSVSGNSMYGFLFGESGNDFLNLSTVWGYALGGDGRDAVIGNGGRVFIAGEGDSDCCVYNANMNPLSLVDCGGDPNDVTGNNLEEPNVVNCAVKKSSCSSIPFSCF